MSAQETAMLVDREIEGQSIKAIDEGISIAEEH